MNSLHLKLKSVMEASPSSGKQYYALTLLLGPFEQPERILFTEWAGYTKDTPRREIRKASLIHADRMLDFWRKIHGVAAVVNSIDDFALFFNFGGHAIVEQSLAEALIPEWLAPNISVNVGEAGYASPEVLPKSALERAPTPKLRMKILQRDRYSCRVCGRSPQSNTDIELHVHHIRPWAIGGVTENTNLMTLCHTCHTCHNGLEPHYEHSLFRLIREDSDTDTSKLFRAKLKEYQNFVALQS
jgi:HNH endonuclease